MWKPIQLIYDSVWERLGNPVALLRLLESQPSFRTDLREPPKDLSAGSIVKWHEWEAVRPLYQPRRSAGELLGYKYGEEGYRSFHEVCEDFANLGSTETTEGWECDIQMVSGLAGSKSNLTHFTSLDDLVETNSKEMISPVTEEKLRANLAHDEVRIINSANTSDHFARYLWDGRLFLINGGGSHHFSAARYIAARLKIPVSLRGKLRTHSINPLSLVRLRRRFDCFLVCDESTVGYRFDEAMKKFRATYLFHPMPAPYDGKRCIFLPKSDRRSAKVSEVLRAAGFFDVGVFLDHLVSRQNRNAASLNAGV